MINERRGMVAAAVSVIVVSVAVAAALLGDEELKEELRKQGKQVLSVTKGLLDKAGGAVQSIGAAQNARVAEETQAAWGVLDDRMSKK